MNEAQLKRACLLCVQEALRACEPQAKKLHPALKPIKTQVVDTGDDFTHVRVIWNRPDYIFTSEMMSMLDQLTPTCIKAIQRKSGTNRIAAPSRTANWMIAFSNRCTLEIQVAGAAMDFVMIAENIED